MAEAPALKLWNNKKEQEKYENLAGGPLNKLLYASHTAAFPVIAATPTVLLGTDLYAIVKTTEKLERAYVRDVISAKDYEPLCEKLIAQFRTLWETLRTEVLPALYSEQAPTSHDAAELLRLPRSRANILCLWMQLRWCDCLRPGP